MNSDPSNKVGDIPASPFQNPLPASPHLSRTRLKRRILQFPAYLFIALIAAYLLIRSRKTHDDGTKTGFVFGHSERSDPSKCHGLVKWTGVLPKSANEGSMYHKRASLQLPLDAESLRFSANTSLAYGNFEISATAPAGSNKAIVDVDVFYNSSEAFDALTMCRIYEDDWDGRETWGMSIFGFHEDKDTRPLHFNIHLRLPARGEMPTELGWLTTYLLHFSHTVHDIEDAVFFQYLSLMGSEGPFLVESVAGHAISVKGANASIEGNFTVESSRFVLWTSHAPIIASVNMGSGGPVWDFDMARLFTNDAEIQATMRLTPRSHNTSRFLNIYTGHSRRKPQPHYQKLFQHSGVAKDKHSVWAYTSNAPMTLIIAEAPADAYLSLSASNSLALVNVSLPSTYQGSFSLETTAPFVPQVLWPEERMKDPTGQRRPYYREKIKFVDGVLKGKVGWGAVETDPAVVTSNVNIKTTGSEVVLGWRGASV